MRVLYVSKASHTPAHRDKLRLLAERVELHAVVPERWNGAPLPQGDEADPPLIALPTLFQGHNHFHVYRGFSGVAARARPDLIHMDEEPYSAVTWQGARVARRLKVPFVFFAWQNVAKRYPPPFGAIRSAVFRAAAGGIAGSAEAGEVLRLFGFEGPMDVIPQMGVDTSRFRPDAATRDRARSAQGVEPGAFVVGYLGRLVPEKGIDVLLDAVAGLPRVAQLWIGGAGPEAARLEARAQTDDLAGRVRFAGAVPSLQVADWLRGIDVLVLPSRTTPGWKEQFGRVLVEAMACGVPVVASKSGEIPHVVGDAGLLVEEGDPAALREALATLVEDPERRRALACEGRRRVEDRFTQRRVVADTLAFYDRVLSRLGR